MPEKLTQSEKLMDNRQSRNRAGRNMTIVGRDYHKTTTYNFVLFIIGILALGGLAWGLYVGTTSNPMIEQQSPAAEQSPISPTKP